ncbi:MAG: LysR family transcriptional regulator [Alphaproteobacteria bacterium]
MNLRDLRYLVAVAETMHFGRAALAENVSQPALSAQIRKLEAFLGVALFERDSRNVALTPAGDAILAAARAVLAHAASIETIANDFRDPLAGPFRVGIIASLGPFLAAELLIQLQHDAPRLAVFLTEGLTDTLLASLRAGDLDAALIATAPADDRLQETVLFDELLPSCPCARPSAGQGRPSHHGRYRSRNAVASGRRGIACAIKRSACAGGIRRRARQIDQRLCHPDASGRIGARRYACPGPGGGRGGRADAAAA